MPVVAARPVASLLLMLGVMIASGSACSSTAACKDLRPINATVREGQLSASQASCLTARLADETDPDREIVSKLLLQNARHLDEDGALWAQQAEAHAAEFPGDVVTIVHLANYWQRQGPRVPRPACATPGTACPGCGATLRRTTPTSAPTTT